jgi:AbrB family looped-hinge helix DNA binding protein
MEVLVPSTITSKGQVTIPKVIRDYLGLRAGDRVKFFLHPDGGLVLLPQIPTSALRGIVKPKACPVTINEMDDAVADRLTHHAATATGVRTSFS